MLRLVFGVSLVVLPTRNKKDARGKTEREKKVVVLCVQRFLGSDEEKKKKEKGSVRTIIKRIVSAVADVLSRVASHGRLLKVVPRIELGVPVKELADHQVTFLTEHRDLPGEDLLRFEGGADVLRVKRLSGPVGTRDEPVLDVDVTQPEGSPFT